MNLNEEDFIEDVQSRALDILDETFYQIEGEGSENQGIEKDLETYKAACSLLAERAAAYEEQFSLRMYPVQQMHWKEYLELKDRLKNEH